MESKTLYKKAKTGKTVQWTIYLSDNLYWTAHGEVGGELVVSKVTTCSGKNIDKANETSPNEQAKLEYLAKITKKLKEGYSEDKDEAGRPVIDPMLAYTLDKHTKPLPEYVLVQPKLDGMRAIINETGMYSRKGNPIFSVPHLYALSKELLRLLPPGTQLDGELYNHVYKHDFEKLISILRTQKPTVEELEHAEKMVEYHLYDLILPNSVPTEERQNILTSIYDLLDLRGSAIVRVPTHLVPSTRITELYEDYLNRGYEGVMVRYTDKEYVNGRTKYLLKVKATMQEEFEICEIQEGKGNRAGMAGRVVVNVPGYGPCGCGIAGGEALYQYIWNNRHAFKGEKATVQFQNFTADGGLRNPVVRAIRNYE